MSGFDPAQLEVLRELEARGSVTEVAAALHRSPSAVSQQLRTLQRQVGVPLVERYGRGVRLTDAGHALAASSLRIAAAMAEAEATWQEFRGGASGTVRVAFFPSAAELLVPGLLTRFAAHPAIEVHIEDHDVSQEGFAGLADDVDIVVAHRSDDSDRAPALTVVPLLREPLDVALPPTHPLAGAASVRMDEVIDDDWVGVPRDYPLDRVLQSMAVQTGRPARLVYRTIHLPLVENLVAAGHGIALMPRHTSLDRARGRFRLVPIADVRAGRHIEALMRPDRAARLAVRTIIDDLRAEAAAIGTVAPERHVTKR